MQLIVGRSSGSSRQHAEQISLTDPGRCMTEGGDGACLNVPHTFCIICGPLSPFQTRTCPNTSIIRHPNAYTSTAAPRCPLLNSSGAMYGNVPLGLLEEVVKEVLEMSLRFEIPMSQMKTP